MRTRRAPGSQLKRNNSNMRFIGRKITNEEGSLGDLLRESREEKELSLEEVSEITKIKIEYLKALEENRLEDLPTGPYKKTFLKKYCSPLGLDWEKIKKEFQIGIDHEKEGKKYSFSPKNIHKKEFIIFPKILKNILTAAIISIFFIYVGFYLKTNLSPPEVKIIQPADNLITNSDSIKVIGQTGSQASITINGQPVLNDESGAFEQKVDLKKGVNIITITAKKKHGPQKTITRQILVE